MNTAFEQWFKANYKNIEGVDRNTAAIMRASAKSAYMLCWNAAVDEAARWISANQADTLQASLLTGAVKVQ